MNKRYLLLSSMYRNRTEYSSQYDFVASYNSVPTNRKTASDWVSNQAPILNYDMMNYFLETDGVTAPYRWLQTGTIVTATSTANSFEVTIDARGNTGAPDPVTGQYDRLRLEYDNGTTVYNESILFFIANGTSTFTIVLANPIDIIMGGAFSILTEPMDLNQIYVPNPLNPILRTNAYTELYITEIVQGITSRRTLAFSALTNIITGPTNFHLSAGPVQPQRFAVTIEKSTLLYTIVAVNAHTITVAVADNPTYMDPKFTDQYLFQYLDGFSAQITDTSTTAGIITLTFSPTVDLSPLTVSEIIGILYYSYDNNGPFDYQEPMKETQSQDRSQVRINDLELLSLQIPNKVMTGYPGGRPSDYPYFLVTLENLSYEQRNESIIYSNNNNINKANFIGVILLDNNLITNNSAFTNIYGNGIICPFNIKSNDTLRLTIRSPLGHILATEEIDPSSPVPPNPMLQVSAQFSITQRPTLANCNF